MWCAFFGRYCYLRAFFAKFLPFWEIAKNRFFWPPWPWGHLGGTRRGELSGNRHPTPTFFSPNFCFRNSTFLTQAFRITWFGRSGLCFFALQKRNPGMVFRRGFFCKMNFQAVFIFATFSSKKNWTVVFFWCANFNFLKIVTPWFGPPKKWFPECSPRLVPPSCANTVLRRF